MKKLLTCIILSICILVLTCPVIAGQDNTVKVKGVSYSVVMPDTAYMYLYIKGTGKNYDESNKSAEEKIDLLEGIIAETVTEKTEIVILKRKNKVKTDDIDFGQKAFIEGMAKAMKGEKIVDKEEKEKEKEKQTVINAYLTFKKLPESDMIKLQGKLAENKIAFSEKNIYDYFSSLNLEGDAVFYGLKEPFVQLKLLSKPAYDNARLHAMAIAEGAGKKLGKISSITTCGSCLEGESSLNEASGKVGKDLGPLSFDPNRLVIKYSADYYFYMK